MIKSMTAFSRVTDSCDNIAVDVTMRAVNSRHLDIVLHCPESCQEFEENIKKIVSACHARGRIEIRLSVRDESEDQDMFEVDMAAASSYFRALEKIKHDLQLSGNILVSDILSGRNIIVPCKKESDLTRIWAAVEPCIEAASASLDTMRKREGKNLYADLSARMDYIEAGVKQIEHDAAEIPRIYKQRLMERVSYLISDAHDIDMVRISQEAAILADKSDVSEEIVRLYSHIRQFRQTLDSEESQGRKLNFLIQEFNREFNTIGSKAGKAALSHRIVDLKSELEKIREQVQNIE
jgi:uncharacterized protein (TIGR00255 family)